MENIKDNTNNEELREDVGIEKDASLTSPDPEITSDIPEINEVNTENLDSVDDTSYNINTADNTDIIETEDNVVETVDVANEDNTETDVPGIIIVDDNSTTLVPHKRYKKITKRVPKGSYTGEGTPVLVKKGEVPQNPVITEAEAAVKPVNKVVKTVIISACVVVAIIAAIFIGKALVNDGLPEEPEMTVTKPVNMDGTTTIGQYSVNVYKNIIIGKEPFVFNNSKNNDAELCYTVMLDGEELFTTDYMRPGAACSWVPEVPEHGKTYNCHIIVTARDIVTGEELNSLDIRQLIYVNNKLPQTTAPSDYKYTVIVDNYSKAIVQDGYVYIGYEVAVHENPAHPLKEGDKIDVRVPETVIVTGHGKEIEVSTNDFEYATQSHNYLHMVGYSQVEDVYDLQYKMVTRYSISGYERFSNGIFYFGE